MKNRILLFVSVISLSLFFAYLSIFIYANNSENKYLTGSRFIVVEECGDYKIFVDTETNVMYLELNYRNSGITVILNSDGTPMLWEN